jgi:hypothetical protein
LLGGPPNCRALGGFHIRAAPPTKALPRTFVPSLNAIPCFWSDRWNWRRISPSCRDESSAVGLGDCSACCRTAALPPAKAPKPEMRRVGPAARRPRCLRGRAPQTHHGGHDVVHELNHGDLRRLGAHGGHGCGGWGRAWLRRLGTVTVAAVGGGHGCSGGAVGGGRRRLGATRRGSRRETARAARWAVAIGQHAAAP